MNVWVVHYSRTGASKRLADVAAEVLSDTGHTVCRSALTARPELPYVLWLAASFLPGLRVPITTQPPRLSPLHGCVLVSPKWTFNCPPITSFLHRWAKQLPLTVTFITCGGWDQERYLRALERRMDRLSIPLRQGMWFKRGDVANPAVRETLKELLVECWSRATPHPLS